VVPNLGVVDIDEFNSFVVADIPGLIEGAHKGHGLGTRFLKHIERTKLIVHIIDVSAFSQRHPVDDFYTVRNELKQFNKKLLKRPQIIVANKIDLLEENKQRLRVIKDFAAQKKIPFFAVSALKGKGLNELIFSIASYLKNSRESNGQ
jgi:GTP-binding protein